MTTTEWVERYNRAFGCAATKRITPEVITHLEPNEVFVFGSNLAGVHGKGAAKQALRFGACYGQGIGMAGQTYAIPTKGHKLEILSLEKIGWEVHHFKAYAKSHQNLTFLVTKVGCGLAGYSPKDIAPLFKDSPPNIVLPADFIPYI